MYQDAKNCLLVARAAKNAAGCGTDNVVRVARRSGASAAAAHATVAPQSWPARWTFRTPRASMRATTSATSSSAT